MSQYIFRYSPMTPSQIEIESHIIRKIEIWTTHTRKTRVPTLLLGRALPSASSNGINSSTNPKLLYFNALKCGYPEVMVIVAFEGVVYLCFMVYMGLQR